MQPAISQQLRYQGNSRYLLDCSVENLAGAKLPSRHDVLALLLHKHATEKKELKVAAREVVVEVEAFWDRARIPTKRMDHCIEKVLQLHKQWQSLKKSASRRSETQVKNEDLFKAELRNLFDVAGENAMSKISVAEDREFLVAQRQPGRQGSMTGVDLVLHRREQRALERRTRFANFQSATAARDSQFGINLESDSASDSSSMTDEAESDREEPVSQQPPVKRTRATAATMTPHLAAALDRTRISDRSAALLLSASAEGVGQDSRQLVINRSSIRRFRQSNRAAEAASASKNLKRDCALVVHWDSKMLPDLTGTDTVHRLPVLVSGGGQQQLLGVPKISSATGEEQAEAVYALLRQWHLEESVAGMSFDTTAANTGHRAGACVLLEHRLGKRLLHFACRHHVLELVFGAAFGAAFGKTTSPEVDLFKRFREKWSLINVNDFSTAAESSSISEEEKSSLKSFAYLTLTTGTVRDDYKEFLELSLLFLGFRYLPNGCEISFKTPGAFHHARWMSKILYSIKMWMFRHQLTLPASQQQALHRLALFAVRVYMKPWFRATDAAAAPQEDLLLLNTLLSYPDRALADAASEKLRCHLWYLSEEMLPLAFFDDNVSASTKRNIVKAMSEKQGYDDCSKKAHIRPGSGVQLEDLASSNCYRFFTEMKISTEFLCHDPSQWQSNDAYVHGQQIVKGIAVVNDHAERAVSLIQQYNRMLTVDEEQLQFLLQVVTKHRRELPL